MPWESWCRAPSRCGRPSRPSSYEEAGPRCHAEVRTQASALHRPQNRDAFSSRSIGLQKDEALRRPCERASGFRLVEAMGIIPREKVATEVKDLDQDARGALRRHGVPFGQFTIFMPALLKPAPTRLRLVLAALAEGRVEFPESPPPGLVTISGGGKSPTPRSWRAFPARGDRGVRTATREVLWTGLARRGEQRWRCRSRARCSRTLA